MKRNNDVSLNQEKEKLEKEQTKEMKKVMENLKQTMNPSEKELNTIKDMSEKFVGKSEDDLFSEILNLNKKLSSGESKEEFQNKLKKLEMLRPLLNEEQQNKLDKILEALQVDK